MLIFAVAVYSVSYLILGGAAETMSNPMKHRIAEALALVPIILINIIEIMGLMRDRQLIADAVLSRIKT